MALTITAHSKGTFSIFEDGELLTNIWYEYVPPEGSVDEHYVYHWNVGNHLGETSVPVGTPATVFHAAVIADLEAYRSAGA